MRASAMMLDEKNFESHVIRVCEQIFSPHLRRELNFLVDGIEYDGLFETDFDIHLIEVTVSRKKEKARQDIEKLSRLIDRISSSNRGEKNVRGWFITQYDLSPEQREILKRYSKTKILHQTYRELVARIIDSSEYLSARSVDRFGSAMDLFTESHDFKKEIFFETGLRPLHSKAQKVSLSQLKKRIKTRQAKRILITGDFGSGKSMHMREIFRDLSKAHANGNLESFPIALNLREFAQLDGPDEALRRHADRLGVSGLGERLIRAWRAGFSTLLIDGFDEMVPRSTARQQARAVEIRKQALLVVRRFVSESPSDTIIVLSGRSHFFPNRREMFDCLGVDESWEHFELQDIASEHETKEFLKNYNADFAPPEWLPRRPLLLGYLAVISKGEGISEIQNLSASDGWSMLLDKFCKREVSQIDTLPLVEDDLKDIYGGLAVRARKRDDGVGPISAGDMISCFVEIFGDEPIEESLGQLMRMPALIAANGQYLGFSSNANGRISADLKMFVSREFADVCSAQFLRKYLEDYNDFRTTPFISIRSSITGAGAEVLARGFDDGQKIGSALMQINAKASDNFAQIDFLQAMIWNGVKFIGRHIVIENCEIPYFDINNLVADISRVEFKNCYFGKITVGYVDSEKMAPNFDVCAVEVLETQSFSSLSSGYFSSNYVEEWLNREVDEEEIISQLNSDRDRIVFETLQKVYEQSGAGRLEKALFSGRPPHRREEIGAVIQELRHAGYLERSSGSNEVIWKPIPSKAGEVRQYLTNPPRELWQAVFGKRYRG